MAEQAEIHKRTLFSMIILSILFFVFGFVTWSNGALIPVLKTICKLNNFSAFLSTFAFYISYTAMSLPMALVIERVGYARGIQFGLALMAFGCLVFIPAAQMAAYVLFLLGLFIIGAGLTLLQTASNPYTVIIGTPEGAPSRIAILGIINKSAGALSPVVLSGLLFSGLTTHMSDPNSIALISGRLPWIYSGLAFCLLVLSLALGLFKLPDIDLNQNSNLAEERGANLLSYPKVILGTLTLFCYVGVEVIAGDTISLYGKHLGLPFYTTLTTYTMVFMVIGYVVGAITVPKLMSPKTALLICGLLGSLFIFGLEGSSERSDLISKIALSWTGLPPIPDPILWVALLGLANAMVWPTLWPLAIDGLGNLTPKASALLIMGIAGGAILPLIFGALVDQTGQMQSAYWIALPCYIAIALYSLFGSQRLSWKK